MTGNLQPLIDSAAYWVLTDARVRAYWALIAGSMAVVMFAFALVYGRKAIKFLLHHPVKKRAE